MDQKFNSPDNLPAPVDSGEALPGVVEHGVVASPDKQEQNLGAPSTIGVQQAADDVTAATVGVQPVVVDPLAGMPAQGGQAAFDPAKDVDVIEKELVEKAKAIIEKNKDDPRAQSTELAGMKREYIKNRFGKSLPDNQAA